MLQWDDFQVVFQQSSAEYYLLELIEQKPREINSMDLDLK